METLRHNRFESLFRGTAYLAFSVVLTALTAILGGPFLYRLFQETGKQFYWCSSLFIAAVLAFAGQMPLALCLFAVTMAIGFVSLIEVKKNTSFFSASFLAVLGSVGFTGLGILVWKFFKDIQILEVLSVHIDKQIEMASKLATFENIEFITTDMLINIFPSLVFSLLFLSLAITFMGKELSRSGFKNQNFMLSQYRVPAMFVLALCLGGLLFVLAKENLTYKYLGLNLLVIVGTFYFIQGLAVFTVLMKTLKMGFIWQLLIYFLIFSQLLFVVLIGFSDFWLDFRQKIYKRYVSKKSGDIS